MEKPHVRNRETAIEEDDPEKAREARSGDAAHRDAEGRVLPRERRYALLADLDARFPGLVFRIVDEQNHVRPHIKIFVGAEAAPRLAQVVKS